MHDVPALLRALLRPIEPLTATQSHSSTRIDDRRSICACTYRLPVPVGEVQHHKSPPGRLKSTRHLKGGQIYLNALREEILPLHSGAYIELYRTVWASRATITHTIVFLSLATFR